MWVQYNDYDDGACCVDLVVLGIAKTAAGVASIGAALLLISGGHDGIK